MEQKKYITLRVMLPAGEAKAAGSLTAMLGQHQINIMDFCTEFNDLTSNLEEGLMFSVEVYRFEDKTYKIKIKKPNLALFVKQVLVVEKKQIKMESLFDLIRIYSEFGVEDLNEVSKFFFSLLKTMKINIV